VSASRVDVTYPGGAISVRRVGRTVEIRTRDGRKLVLVDLAASALERALSKLGPVEVRE
jgi:hypothetical protein